MKLCSSCWRLAFSYIGSKADNQQNQAGGAKFKLACSHRSPSSRLRNLQLFYHRIRECEAWLNCSAVGQAARLHRVKLEPSMEQDAVEASLAYSLSFHGMPDCKRLQDARAAVLRGYVVVRPLPTGFATINFLPFFEASQRASRCWKR